MKTQFKIQNANCKMQNNICAFRLAICHLPITICFLLFALCILPFASKTQSLGYYSLVQNNWGVYNAAAPNAYFLRVKQSKNFAAQNTLDVSYRQQWTGVPGSPANYNIRYESLLANSADNSDYGVKFGGGLIGESVGPYLAHTIYGCYAYPLSFGGGYSKKYDNERLYIGANVGFSYRRFDAANSNLFFEDPNAQGIKDYIQSQTFLNGQSVFTVSPALFYFSYSRSFYVGISAPNLITTQTIGVKSHVFNTNPQVHLLIGGFSPDLTIQPSLWVRWQYGTNYQTLFDNNPVSATLNVRTQIQETMIAGLGLSTSKLIHLQFGWNVGDFKKGYNKGRVRDMFINFSYDFPLLTATSYHFGQTGEINFMIAL